MKTITMGKLELYECDAQEWAELTGIAQCINCVEARTGKHIQTVWLAVGCEDVYTEEGKLDCKDVLWASATGILFTDGSYGCLHCYSGPAGRCMLMGLDDCYTQVETFAELFRMGKFVG